jgi:hypothetical protein
MWQAFGLALPPDLERYFKMVKENRKPSKDGGTGVEPASPGTASVCCIGFKNHHNFDFFMGWGFFPCVVVEPPVMIMPFFPASLLTYLLPSCSPSSDIVVVRC